MKFNKVAALCKRNRAVYILTERDEDGVVSSRAIHLDTMEALKQAVDMPQYQPEKAE